MFKFVSIFQSVFHLESLGFQQSVFIESKVFLSKWCGCPMTDENSQCLQLLAQLVWSLCLFFESESKHHPHITTQRTYVWRYSRHCCWHESRLWKCCWNTCGPWQCKGWNCLVSGWSSVSPFFCLVYLRGAVFAYLSFGSYINFFRHLSVNHVVS